MKYKARLLIFFIILISLSAFVSAETIDDFNRANNATVGNGWSEYGWIEKQREICEVNSYEINMAESKMNLDFEQYNCDYREDDKVHIVCRSRIDLDSYIYFDLSNKVEKRESLNPYLSIQIKPEIK